LEKLLKITVLFLIALLAVTVIFVSCANPQTALPNESTWLSPGKIQINNLYPGKSITQLLKIHNGSKQTAQFMIYYRAPDYVETDYVAAPAKAVDWISITDKSPVLAPQEIREIPVTVCLPGKTQAPERWEFWIGAKENSKNTLSTELCSRWLITMKDK
jgi:hypothetical protein